MSEEQSNVVDKKIPSLVVNLFGGPSVGKSVLAAQLFVHFKIFRRDISCEMTGEYAKGMVYDNRKTTLTRQNYMLAKQDSWIDRLVGKVNLIICESPIALVKYYSKDSPYHTEMCNLIDSIEDKATYDTLDVQLHRRHDYEDYGRLQNEDEAVEINNTMDRLFGSRIDVHYHTGSDSSSPEFMYLVEQIEEALRNMFEKEI